MNNQFVTYINTLGDKADNMSPLTLQKEYHIHSEGSITDPNDAWLIVGDNHQQQYYFKTRFSEPFSK